VVRCCGTRCCPDSYASAATGWGTHGIIALAAVAIVLVVGFEAKTTALLPLYAIGVVTSFVLAQAGMTKHDLTERESGWRHGLLVNGWGRW
jgi:hypothetical protein